MKTKEQLIEWVCEALVGGCAVPMVINGGGYSAITDSDARTWYKAEGIEEDDDYRKYVEELLCCNDDEYGQLSVVTGDDIYPDFADFIDVDGYEVYRIEHNNGYNQENHDIQLATWEL